MARFIYVVDRSRPDLQERLSADYAGQDVQVVRNRREGERRQGTQGRASDQRRGDRRRQRALDEELRTEGYFISAGSDSVMIIVP